MTVEDLLQALDRKDNTEAYQALLELERLSSDSNVLYTYTEKFAEMTESDRNVVRVRGVRLFCSQAKWDSGSMIDRFLDQVLSVLQDDRPTTVRQTLAALQDVVRYKPELRDKVIEAADKIDVSRYKDTMQGLLIGDIGRLHDMIDRNDE
mgnify:FL=1